MRLLVLGANGLLGSNVVASAIDRGWSVAGTFHSSPPSFEIDVHQLDIRRSERVDRLLTECDPAHVVNCAAMTDVDACEVDPEQAHAVNGRAPGAIAAACSELGADIVHVSTDYVFDGTSNRPYAEDAQPGPLQVYGETKLAGERAVRAAHDDPLVVRLSFVYGRHGATTSLTGFPAWVAERLMDGTETTLFDDQRITPTRARQAATVVLDLLDMGATATFHVASRSCVTPYQFGAAVCRRLGSDASLLERGSMSDVDRPARRPRYTCLDVARTESVLGRPQPTLEADLDTLDEALG